MYMKHLNNSGDKGEGMALLRTTSDSLFSSLIFALEFLYMYWVFNAAEELYMYTHFPKLLASKALE